MSCNIISSSHASLNGSCSAYGGSISSATFTPSLLNGQHRATVTLVGESISSPAQGDDLDLSIGSLNLPMVVGSYTITNAAGSMTRLTINLYDKSHQFLDNSFVLLKEDVPDSLASEDIAILGRKKGPHPDIGALEGLGIITPASDTVFVDIRSFYSSYPLFENTIDTLVQQAAGKTNWFWDQDADGGQTLSEAYGDLIEGEFPNGPYSFHGRLRDVIVQICDMAGMTAYWDMEKEKVITSVTSAPVSLDTTSCTVVSTSSTEDFTVTRANGAAGSFTSSFPGNNQNSSGGKMTRYFKATLVDPTLHYKQTCGATELTELNFEEQGLQKALSASLNPSVYAMYALQSVLSKQPNALPSQTFQRNFGSSRDDANSSQEFSLNGANKKNNQYSGNDFLANYYLNSTNDGCTAKNVFSIDVQGQLKKVFDAAAIKKWNTNKGSLPYSKLGEWKGGKFEFGNVFLYKQGGFTSIIDDNANLVGEGDLLRNYLQAVLAIKGNLYVVKDNTGKRTVQRGGRNYGYYVTSSAGGMGARPESPDGFQTIQINPFRSLADCGDPIKTWATVLYSMYTTSDGCVDTFLNNTQVVEFIYALDQASEFYEQVEGGESRNTNSLKALFEKGGSQTVSSESQEGAQEYTMFLIIRNSIFNPISAFDSQKLKCFSHEIFDVDIPGVLKNIVNAIGQLDFEAATLPQIGARNSSSSGSESENYIFAGVADVDVSDYIEPTVVSTKSPRSIKMWYEVDGASASVNLGPSEIFLSNAEPPPSNENTWKSSMSLGLSVNSADIAANLGIQQTYLADTSNETFKYSKLNIPFMQQNLREKISANAGVEDEIGRSESVTYLLADGEFPEIPSISQGLDSLDIRSSNGKTELTVTAGNANLLRSKAALKDLKAVNSHILNETVSLMPDVLNSAPNARIQNIAKGNL